MSTIRQTFRPRSVRCVHCRAPFTLTADQALNTTYPRRFCSKVCAAAHRREKPTGRTCPACAGPVLARAWRSYGLDICQDCRAVAYRGCWRKFQYATAEQAAEYSARLQVTPYDCELCPFFHTSGKTVTPDYAERVTKLGEYLRSISFDINQARGWGRPPLRVNHDK